MIRPAVKNDLIQQLQREICSLQGFNQSISSRLPNLGLEKIEMAFPDKTFPIGVVHEFISPAQEDATATNGFIAGILGKLMQQKGTCLWVSTRRNIFPATLKQFGIDPGRIIFVDLFKPKDALWAIEEGLKCKSLSAVVGEIKELGFTESRRLQLAVEQSQVTGFIHRYQPRSENTVACVTRWKISPVSSVIEDGMPGLGHPRWDVRLLKVRNGRPGAWQVEWVADHFQQITTTPAHIIPQLPKLKTG